MFPSRFDYVAPDSVEEVLSEHESTSYYFCAPGCRRAFLENPDNYLQAVDEYLQAVDEA